MLENAQWKHLVNGLNKAFPKPQGNTDSKYGPMNRIDIGEIQKYKASLPQEELDKWRHQNQMIDQVVAMKYDKTWPTPTLDLSISAISSESIAT